jgi:hypothetical protein
MREFLYHDGPEFRLRSYGNGTAYSLDHKPAHETVFVQGDDAVRFETDLEAINAHRPDWTYEQVCRWLWDQCDYGSAAS